MIVDFNLASRRSLTENARVSAKHTRIQARTKPQATLLNQLGIPIGLGWVQSPVFTTGQCLMMKYSRQLMQAILCDKIQIAKAVNVKVIRCASWLACIDGVKSPLIMSAL